MSNRTIDSKNTVLTVDEYRLVLAGFNPMWGRNEQITNAKKNTEVEE